MPQLRGPEALVNEVATEKALSLKVDKVTDIAEIMSYGIVSTPGLVVDGQVVSSGRVPPKAEIATMMQSAVAQ